MQRSSVTIACLLALALSCESAHRQLNSINDLKKIDFGGSVPRHSLLLLHWFANVISIDRYNTITLNFNPDTDFGSHHYGNHEDLLDRPPYRSRYYTVGNLYEESSGELPHYVRRPPVSEFEGTNRDRIIFSAERDNGEYRITRVYLTRHQAGSNDYDPDHTYEISLDLLRGIRQFSNGNPSALRGLRDQFQRSISDSQIKDLRETWGNRLACLGLLLLIVLQRNYSRSLHFTNQCWSAGSTVQSSVYNSSSNRGVDETWEKVCLTLLGLLALTFVAAVLLFAPKP